MGMHLYARRFDSFEPLNLDVHTSTHRFRTRAHRSLNVMNVVRSASRHTSEQTEPDNFPRLMELMQDMQEHGQVSPIEVRATCKILPATKRPFVRQVPILQFKSWTLACHVVFFNCSKYEVCNELCFSEFANPKLIFLKALKWKSQPLK